MVVIEVAAKLSFSFPVFFHVAILDNTPRGRYKAVHNLICGFDPDDIDNDDVRKYIVANGIVSGYINGNRPISDTLTSRYLSMSREEQINHIRMVGLQQPLLAANALVHLLNTGLIDMDPNDIERYLGLSNSESTEAFLADMLTLAIKHRLKQPLSKATREMLARIRENLNVNDNAPIADSPEDTGLLEDAAHQRIDRIYLSCLLLCAIMNPNLPDTIHSIQPPRLLLPHMTSESLNMSGIATNTAPA